ncbi:MAG: Ni/Fe hydrogenase subunit alpha [Candidatus Altiarchaeota archaeon]|nr:Ni/Fe hydrogenase subunit alpha [Candidatus Altiarchaeota archaeon]
MKNVVPHYIAKIEGHGSLRIDYTTESAKMQIHEGERLFEAMLVGRNYEDGVFIPQRICGVCPTAHCMSALKALEYAMDIEVSKTTRDLRKLMLCGQMIQSHALHLFFLVVPDYLHVDSALALVDAAPDKFRMALNLKKIGDKIVEVVGGRPVHPITPQVGGFSKVPTKQQLTLLRKELEITLADGVGCVKLFASLHYPELENPTQYLSIQADNKYGFYGGLINSSTGDVFDISDYKMHIEEFVQPYSNAKFSKTKKNPMMVGSLSRLNLHSIFLNPMASEELEASGIKFPSYNSFHNNFAQAVEILHFIEEAIARIDDVLNEGLADYKQKVKAKAGVGSGAVEAPRGTLYYTYGVDDRGKITECNIITPTVQNLFNIEYDAQELLQITAGKKQAERERLLEMLIRAYDPCITCSVH